MCSDLMLTAVNLRGALRSLETFEGSDDGMMACFRVEHDCYLHFLVSDSDNKCRKQQLSKVWHVAVAEDHGSCKNIEELPDEGLAGVGCAKL